jgi:putative nucleotidyltransferase with HDIG domain
MNSKLTAYIGSVVTAAALASVAVGFMGGPPDGASLQAVACFAAFGFVAQVQAFRLPHSAAGSISFLPFLCAALIAPNWVTVSAAFVSMAVAEATRGAQLAKAVFNVAQLCLSIACGILFFLSLGGVGIRFGDALPGAAYVSLIVVYFAVNSLAVSAVVAISQGQPFAAIWKLNTLRTGLYDLVALPVVYCFVQVYLRIGVSGLVLLAVLILGARQLYSANLELQQANQDLLQVMVAAIELRDPYTSGHSQRVARYSKVIARAIGLAPKEVERVGVAALLHDVGKIDQRFAEILQKPGRLTDEERLVIEEHPVRSAELVAMVSGLQDLVTPVRHHHERWDGGGYPDGLAGEQIPLFARIIVFADTIDAMTSDRPYRPALGPADVRRELVKHRAKQFDPFICDKLLASEQYESLFANGPARDEPALLPSTPELPASIAKQVAEPVIAA